MKPVMKNLLNRSSLLQRLSIMTVIVPLALLWGEIFTRVLLPQNVDSKMNIFESDPVVGFTYKPNASTYEKGREYNALYQINSLGLRDREYGEKRDGVFRILLLGDSFSVSHGMPIEDSLSRQLERALQAIAVSEGMSVKIEVINAAVGGYSPYNYWKAYRRWAPVLKPDTIVVGLSPDDYDCSNEHLQYLIEKGMTLSTFKDGQKPPESGMVSINKLRQWLSWNSEFYILLRNFLYYNDHVGRIYLWMNVRAAEQNNQLQQYIVAQPESMTRVWAKTFFYLQKLKKDISDDGVALIILSIPLKMEVDPEVYRHSLAASGLAPLQINLDQPFKQISAFSKAENIPILDPRQALRKRHAEVPCYFVYDGHWIAEGIRAATRAAAIQWHAMGFPPFDNVSNTCWRE